jgi:hypothetical protein
MPNLPKRCHHIKMNGTQCGSPALTTERFCFFHFLHVPRNIAVEPPDRTPPDNFVLPILENATAVQLAVTQVTALLLRGRISDRRARILLCALRMAAENLNRMDTEKPRPTQMIFDLKTIPETPMGMTPWSVTGEGHDPEDALPPGTIQACQSRRESRM